jgi:hypothetical protein
MCVTRDKKEQRCGGVQVIISVSYVGAVPENEKRSSEDALGGLGRTAPLFCMQMCQKRRVRSATGL